jgi:hypothetical protein
MNENNGHRTVAPKQIAKFNPSNVSKARGGKSILRSLASGPVSLVHTQKSGIK